MKKIFSRFIQKYSSFILLTLIAGWIYFHRTNFFLAGNGIKGITVIENNNQCDLQKNLCMGEITNTNKFQLEIKPRPIIANQKQKAILRIQDSSWIPEEIDFTGVGMEMGYNRPVFTKSGDNEFTADFILEACASGEIQWKALVLLKTEDKKKYGIPFYFKVGSGKK